MLVDEDALHAPRRRDELMGANVVELGKTRVAVRNFHGGALDARPRLGLWGALNSELGKREGGRGLTGGGTLSHGVDVVDGGCVKTEGRSNV